MLTHRGIGTLSKILRLEIDDYTDDKERRQVINEYHDVMIDYMSKNNIQFMLHARHSLGV